nr:hypothetical protein [Tanacetum cinerariifolium]
MRGYEISPKEMALTLENSTRDVVTNDREAIRGIHEHLLEVPIQEELRTLRDRLDVAEVERTTLRATVRTMGQSRQVFVTL